jgi:branched-chain amino acid aminotransferase
MPKQPRTSPDSDYITSINGRIVSPRRATVAIQDWGFRYGWGAFETIRLTKGCPLFLGPHLGRFLRTAASLLIEDADQSVWWQRAIAKTIAKTEFTEGAINLYWTRGESPRFDGQRIIVVRPQSGRAPRKSRVWICPWPIEPATPGVGAKTLCYLPYTFATLAAHAEGFDDALLLNTQGQIADASAASFFIVKGGKLATPSSSDGALPGITREMIFRCADLLNIPVARGPVSFQRAQRADGAFLTSSLRGITPVRALGNCEIKTTPDAKRIFDSLRHGYRRLVAADLASYQR